MYTPSGFEKAPVSRLVLFGTTGVALAYQNWLVRYMNLDLARCSSWPEVVQRIGGGRNATSLWWKFPLANLTWTTPTELVLGGILAYNLYRVHERLWGTRKFSLALIIFFILNITAEIGIIKLFAMPLSSGPYSILFALLPAFMMDVPYRTPFKVFRFIRGSEKLFIYVLAGQIAFTNGQASLCSAVVAAGIGLIWRATPLSRLAFPQSVARAFSKIFGSSSSSAHRFAGSGAVGTRANGGNINTTRGTGYQTVPQHDTLIGNPRTAPLAATVRINETALAQIVAMGFEPQRAEEALRLSDNNVDAAIARLVE